MPDAPIRVVIVDDQPLFVSGMQMLLDAQGDIVCVGTASDGRESLAVTARERPDIVLMDLRMPVMNGIEATRLMLESVGVDEPPRVIVLTTLQKDEAVYNALRAGAAAFLTKDATPADVLGTIRGIHRGQKTPNDLAAVNIVHAFGDAAPKEHDPAFARLSGREREVMALVARGLSNSEIAGAAYISEATAKSHVRSILTKLSLRSRVQIVIYAYENGHAAPLSPQQIGMNR